MIVVIGAGPAGLMAAGMAASRGLKVRLLDRNGFAGKKLNITGKGRCNVTNDCEIAEFMENIPRNGRFLYGALSRFGPQDMMKFLEDRDVPLKVERGRRVFPASDRAADVTNALTGWLGTLGVSVEHKRVRKLVIRDGQVQGVDDIPCTAVIVATGGLSYPGTGSTGDGYALARQAGHAIIAPQGALVPLESCEDDIKSLQGLSLRNVTLSCGGFSELGELLFTHFGLSGPLTLSASSHVRPGDALSIDCKPGLDEAALDRRILRDIEEFHSREAINGLKALLPHAMIPLVIGRAGIAPETRMHSVTREQRGRLLGVLKRFTVTVKELRPVEEAIVTAGGVDVREIVPRSMASKKVKGLYFAGEALDVNGYTGGYNLQIAWSTGAVAGWEVEDHE